MFLFEVRSYNLGRLSSESDFVIFRAEFLWP